MGTCEKQAHRRMDPGRSVFNNGHMFNLRFAEQLLDITAEMRARYAENDKLSLVHVLQVQSTCMYAALSFHRVTEIQQVSSGPLKPILVFHLRRK